MPQVGLKRDDDAALKEEAKRRIEQEKGRSDEESTSS